MEKKTGNKIIFYITIVLSSVVWIWTISAFLGSGIAKQPISYIISLLPIILWGCGFFLEKLLGDKTSQIFRRVLYVVLLLIVAIFFLINIFNNFNRWLLIYSFTIFYWLFNIFSFGLGFLLKNSLEIKKGEVE